MFQFKFFPVVILVLGMIPQAQAHGSQDKERSRKAPEVATNTQCPVMGGKVDEKNLVVTVQNRQYRLCCQECGEKLARDPRHYFNSDGSLTGAWEDNTYTNHR